MVVFGLLAVSVVVSRYNINHPTLAERTVETLGLLEDNHSKYPNLIDSDVMNYMRLEVEESYMEDDMDMMNTLYQFQVKLSRSHPTVVRLELQCDGYITFEALEDLNQEIVYAN